VNVQRSLLIVGASGFLGYELSLHFRDRFRVVSTFVNQAVPIEGVLQVPLDLKDKDWLKALIWRTRPEIIVYVAGYQDIGYQEGNPSLAERMISKGPGEIIKVADILQPHLIYLSSCYVFEGKEGNYEENATLSPGNTLGKLKMSGENLVRAKASSYTIVRSAPLLGISHAWRPTILDSIRFALARGTPITLQNSEIHNFAATQTMIELISLLVENPPKKAILHVGGLDKLTHYELGQWIARQYGFNEDLIRPATDQPSSEQRGAEYPLDYSLQFTETLKNYPVTAYGLAQAVETQLRSSPFSSKSDRI